MGQLLTNMWRDRKAQEMIEYALLAALTAAASVGVFPMLLTSSGVFQHVYDIVTAGLQAAGSTGTTGS